MTIVYPLTTQIDYCELKYSLRSIEKYLPAPFEVVIVGDNMPEWINNVTQIELPDIKGQNQYSVRRKIIAALHYASSEIFFFNDDIYLLEKAGANFPYYSSGVLEKIGESGAKPLLKQLQSHGKPAKYFGHYPAVYKRDFTEVINNFSIECITKSAYCNFTQVESIEVSDCKILTAKKEGVIREFIKDRPCFSTGVYSIQSALPVLEELFPEPSKYEI